MPSRVIRGEILSSDSLSRVSLAAEALFWRLLIAADDYGRLDGRIQVLRSLIYPARDVPEKKLDEWLVELELDVIDRYEVSGRCYIQITGWEKHRSNSKRGPASRFPQRDSSTERPRNSRESTESPGIRPSVGDESRESSVRLGAANRPARSARGAPKTQAPLALSDEEKRLLSEWTRTKCPSLSSSLESQIEACLDWHRAKGNVHSDWVAACRTWLRRSAETRQNGSGPTISGRPYIRQAPVDDRSDMTDEERAYLKQIQSESRARREQLQREAI